MIQNTAKVDFKIKAGDTLETFHIVANLNQAKEQMETPETKTIMEQIDADYAPFLDAAKEKETVSKRLDRVNEDISEMLQLIALEDDKGLKKELISSMREMRGEKRELEDKLESIGETHSRSAAIEASNKRENAIAKLMFSIGLQDGTEKEKLIARLEELNFAFSVAYQELILLVAEARAKK